MGTEYDVLVVGGGTAGAVVARRVADAGRSVALLEAGPSDEDKPRVLRVADWADLVGSDLDYGYAIEPQPWGNSDIHHARAGVLGGCSSHNSCIAFTAAERDLRDWVARGATGWGPEDVRPYYERVLDMVHVAEPAERNPLNDAVIEAAERAGLPHVSFGGERLVPGAGRFRLNVKDGVRQSSSVAYLHPTAGLPATLDLRTGLRVRRVLVEGGRATGVDTDGGTLRAREVVLCAGAFDTPKLLMLSGIGPADQLTEHGIDVAADLPGVGEHLLDHPEGVLNWRTSRPIPPERCQGWEVGVFACVEDESGQPDLMLHFGLEPFTMHTEPAGYPTAEHACALTPNVCRACSEGVVRLRSADPDAPPVIDFRYFTDPDGYDERIMLAGVHLAREIAAQPPLAEWIDAELTPGRDVTADAELSAYARGTANTVYHPAGTCRMGAPDDAIAVVAPDLRVRGVDGLRVADASVFPSLTSANPGITCMMIGERAADLLLARMG